MNIHCFFVLVLQFGLAFSAEYKPGDEVVLYVNKVGPYENPHETYHYYKLPVCHPSIIEHKPLTLGEVLDGDLLAKSLYQINFRENRVNQKLCDLTLSDGEIDYLKHAIEENYFFEFVADEIPIRGFIGFFEEQGLVQHVHKIYLSTHIDFYFYYNENHVIYANLSTTHRSVYLNDAEAPYKISPTYSVSWMPIGVSYGRRDSVMSNTNFFPNSLEVRWISVINSAFLVVVLLLLVSFLLMRVLWRDFARYNVEKGSVSCDEEYGWKLVHGDVFRIPDHIELLSAILGVGVQLLAIGFVIILTALLGFFSVHRHATMTVLAIVLYALTSLLSGCVSGAFYRKSGGTRWIRQFNLTAVLFTGPVVLIWMIKNSVAWAYHSTQALPFMSAMMIGLLWLFVGYPATGLGASISRVFGSDFDFPCRTKKIEREVPVTPFFQSAPIQYVVGGFFSFSAVSVEIYYVLSAIWGRESYSLFGILALVFVLLLSVVICVSISFTYFLLSIEDHHWWWRSVFTCGSTSLYILAYSIYYYFELSNMWGGLQTIEFIGWSLITAYAFFLALGTVSFLSSYFFVRYIYRNLKMD